MRIFISGKKQSGKNTLGLMIGFILNNKINELENRDNNYIANWNNFKNILELEHNGILNTSFKFPNVKFDSFAKPLKEIASTLLNCDVKNFESEEFKNKESIIVRNFIKNIDFGTTEYYSKNLTNREVLIWLGDVIRKDNPYYFVYSLIERNKLVNNLIVTDLRLKDEVNQIRADYNNILIRVDKPNNNSNIKHDTETGLDDYEEWDYKIINNKSLECLYKEAETIVNDLILKYYDK